MVHQPWSGAWPLLALAVPGEAKSIFRALDRDRDGLLSPTEFMEAGGTQRWNWELGRNLGDLNGGSTVDPRWINLVDNLVCFGLLVS